MYITLVELAEQPGAKELAQVATPRRLQAAKPDLLDAMLREQDLSAWPAGDIEVATAALDVIVAAVNDAQGYIDGFLARRGYPLPLTRRYGIVTRWARAIIRYSLHQERLTGEQNDPIVRDYRDALKFLQLVADGKFSLGQEDPLTPPSSGAPEFSKPPRVFSGDTLKDF
jgi:phage gp36-like protein